MKFKHIFHNMPPVAGWLMFAIESHMKYWGWEVGHWNTSYNSFYIYKPGVKKQFHFRWWLTAPDAIEVLDSKRNGNTVTWLQTEDDILKFTALVKRTK
jgi:hypothetical protein